MSRMGQTGGESAKGAPAACPRPRPRLARGLVWAVWGLIVALVGFLLYFNLWLYPGLGMAGLGRGDHRLALDRAAMGFARSQGMAMEGYQMVKYREVEGHEAYVWGAAVMRPGPREAVQLGERCVVWVYLSWDGFRRSWVRVDAQILAAPDNEMFFTWGRPGQGGRTVFAIDKIVNEEGRRFREVWQ